MLHVHFPCCEGGHDAVSLAGRRGEGDNVPERNLGRSALSARGGVPDRGHRLRSVDEDMMRRWARCVSVLVSVQVWA